MWSLTSLVQCSIGEPGTSARRYEPQPEWGEFSGTPSTTMSGRHVTGTTCDRGSPCDCFTQSRHRYFGATSLLTRPAPRSRAHRASHRPSGRSSSVRARHSADCRELPRAYPSRRDRTRTTARVRAPRGLDGDINKQTHANPRYSERDKAIMPSWHAKAPLSPVRPSLRAT